MHVVLVQFRVKPDKAEAFLARVGQQAQDSLTLEPGCHIFDVCAKGDDPSRVLLYEVYTDPAAFDAHLATDHFRAFDAEVADWVASKTVERWEREEPEKEESW